MKMKKYIFAIAIALVGLVSCDKYLDTMPDNRTEIDTEEKVKALLKSAYPTHWYVTVTEYLSDQLDNMSAVVSGTQGQFFQDLWNWKDNTLSNNSSPRYIWSDSWSVIACANQALEAIQDMGGPNVSPAIAEAYGEALICRAYAHFILVNVFCLHYTALRTWASLTWKPLRKVSIRNMSAEMWRMSMRRSTQTSRKE